MSTLSRVITDKLLFGIAAVGSCMIFRKLYWNFYRSYFKLPPGPVGYPLIGSLPNLYLNTEKYLNYICNEYGEISSVFVGYNNLIIISNSTLLKQIWTNKNFIHRPFKSSKNLHVKRKVRPFPFINGSEWKLRRKNFSTSIIAMLESTKINKIIKRVLNDTIFPELDKRIMYNNTDGITVNDICHLAVFNTLYSAAFGTQISMNDTHYVTIKDWIETIFAEKNAFDPGRFNKTFRHLMGTFDAEYKSKTDKVAKAIKNKQSIFCELIKSKSKISSYHYDKDKNMPSQCPFLRESSISHGATDKNISSKCPFFNRKSSLIMQMSETEESKEESVLCTIDGMGEDITNNNGSGKDDEKGFVDIMIEEQKKNNNNLSFDMIIDDIGTVFTAGTDTTSAVIEVCIYYLVIHNNLQCQIYNELYKCINDGNTNYFDFKLQMKCPLFRAFIHESMRMHGVGVISPARSCKKDIYINYKSNEYLIPKNSIIIGSLVGMGSNKLKSNKKTWGDNVDKFDINRWLHKKGSNYRFQYNQNFHIFSFGRRDCPGRSLAMKDIILIMSNLILNYKFGAFNNDLNKFVNDFKQNKKYYSVYRYDPALKLSIAKRYIC